MNCFENRLYGRIVVLLSFVLILNFYSCGSNDDGIENRVQSIELVVDYTEMTLGGSVSFSVFGNDGSDLTASSTIYVGNTQLNGTSYTGDNEGTVWFYATYNNLNSSSISVHFSTIDIPGFTHKVLIEDYTGTWCGWCPRISYGLEKLEEHTENAVVVAIHRAGDDPFIFNESGIENLDSKQYPTGMLNRTTKWDYPQPDNIAQVLDLIKNKADIGLAIDSENNTSTLDIKVSVGTTKNYGLFNLVVYLVEDKLYHDQRNYTPYYNQADPITNFEHNNVLRAVLTNIYGDPVYDTTEEFSRTFSIDTPSNISNLDNLKIVAFVTKSNGDVLNAQVAKLGVKIEFEK